MAKMISKETLTVGIFAVLAGLVAAYGVRSFLVREEVPAPPPAAAPALLKVLVASADLPADRVVSIGDIVQLPMTRQQFDKRFKGVEPEQVLMSSTSIVGRRLSEPISRGQPFLTTKLYLENTSPSISKKLQPGFRAIRVQVSGTHEGGVQPGIFVDVFFRAQARPAKKDQVGIPEKTLTLLKHIEVLEADRPGTVAGAPGAPKGVLEKKPMFVTLAVPEEKAEFFSIIEGRGELWLVPTPSKGNAGDAGATVSNASTLAELLQIRLPQPPPAPFETAIYRRNHLQVNRFVDGRLLASHTKQFGPAILEKAAPPVPANLPAAPSKEE